MALAAVLSIVHCSHEDTSAALSRRYVSIKTASIMKQKTYLRSWALSPQTLDLAISVHLVVLEHSQLCLLALVLDLLGRGVHFLLALLRSAT